jgi:3-methylcrotonyl-CoA carboxylase alpha subunit
VKRLLIANRGEIACRIIRSAHELGIETVAIYSTSDSHSPHTLQATSAIEIPGKTAQETYLNISKIMEIAKTTGADAIHPGYGFLSENPDFAQACFEQGIQFVGPSVDIIRLMGSKTLAKEAAQKAGLPLIPGYSEANQDNDWLKTQASEIGFPLMIKATMGGGGKGMRIVTKSEDFLIALESCQREALSAFGNAEVMLEKYIAIARHIEVQVFGDTHGHIIHIFDRDCSIQRRHQKMLEEAPAMNLPDAIRHTILSSAVNLAKSVGYVGPGTVEFLVDEQDKFYFMEMNTRLQVEHPVTEMVSGLDLVAMQLKVAMGKPLGLEQSDIHIRGHAVEARLYAEDPFQGFLPSIGTLFQLNLPQSPSLRIDSGVRTGNEIMVHYDPMLAKFITYGDTREAAIHTLEKSLRESQIFGVKTNQPFLLGLLKHPDVQIGKFHTHFLSQNLESILDNLASSQLHIALALALAHLPETVKKKEILPFSTPSFFNLNLPRRMISNIRLMGNHYSGYVTWEGGHIHIEQTGLPTITLHQVRLEESVFHSVHNHEAVHVPYSKAQETIWANLLGLNVDIHILPILERKDQVSSKSDLSCIAPLPGKIIKLWAAEGQVLNPGDPMMTLEAMKMEHTLKAQGSCVIGEILVKEGQLVKEGETLIHMKEKHP